MLEEKVSIITPSYNSSKFIQECVNSVIAQTYKNWEMLIVDDCSKDDSREIIRFFSDRDKRIQYFFLNKNVGAAEARNVAIRNAKGRYIAFLDSDDIWLPQKLEKQIAFMSKNSLAFTCTTYQPISENGKKTFRIIKVPKEINYNFYLKNTVIGCLTVIIDIEITGTFEMPNIRSSHDMALWLLIMKRGFSAYGLDENLARYRISSSSNTSNKIKASKDVWKVYREVEGLNLLFSLWVFLNYVFNAIKKRI